MRLFQKTLLLFVTVITLQSLLTISFIGRTVSKSQSVDASRELAREASAAYDNFNYWKLSLWKHINILREDESLRALVHESKGTPFTADHGLIGTIRQAAARAGVEFAIVKNEDSSPPVIIPIAETNQAFLDADAFKNRKDHPYIDIIQLHNTLYFTGVVRINAFDGETFADVFLIKQIDRKLLENLSPNQRVEVLLSTTGGFLEGTFFPEGLSDQLLDGSRNNAYTAVDNVEINGELYNAIIQYSGSVRSNGNTDMLSLVVFLSRSEYQRQLANINNAILTISLFGAFATILLSLVFSKHLTSPIHNLVGAMNHIEKGDYHISIPSGKKGEIGELLNGFNEMARQLSSDKNAREDHMHQIMQLKIYNENIINAIREGLVVVNGTLTVEKTNQSFLELFALQEEAVIGASLSTLDIGIVDDPLIQEIGNIVSEKKPSASIVKKAPAHHVYEIKLYPLHGGSENDSIRCIMVFEDISSRVEYEEKIFQAEKLASMSMLSAGMAHEINNPLSSILTNTQNLIEGENDAEKAETLRLIELETKRIAGIVRGLLDFSSTHSDEGLGADVNATIGEITRLVGYSLKRENHITIETQFDPACPQATISVDELKQVILNLIKNALQAIPGTGTITVGTRYLGKTRRIAVTVTDTGVGISSDHLLRVFDPFFTTKTDAAGTGLGLSVVYGIITKCKGVVSVDSTPGKGTEIRFELPEK